jgi:hypothetical protein
MKAWASQAPPPNTPANSAWQSILQKLAKLLGDGNNAALTAVDVALILGGIWLSHWRLGLPSLLLGLRACYQFVCGTDQLVVTDHVDNKAMLGVGLDEGYSFQIGISSEQGKDSGFGVVMGGEVAAPPGGGFVEAGSQLPFSNTTNSLAGGWTSGEELGVSGSVSYTADLSPLIPLVKRLLGPVGTAAR